MHTGDGSPLGEKNKRVRANLFFPIDMKPFYSLYAREEYNNIIIVYRYIIIIIIIVSHRDRVTVTIVVVLLVRRYT